MTPDLVRQLLPKNATTLERAAVETLYERIEDIALVIASIWNPRECPVELLPWLAWANSVDVWDDQWSESVKRDVIAAAPMVHKKKATVWALERAFQALQVDIKLTEWWQKVPQGRRGTFSLDVFFDDPERFQSAEVDQAVERILRSTKPKSRFCFLRKGIVQRQNMRVSQSGVAAIRLTGRATPRPPYEIARSRHSVSSAASLGIRLSGTATPKTFVN